MTRGATAPPPPGRGSDAAGSSTPANRNNKARLIAVGLALGFALAAIISSTYFLGENERASVAHDDFLVGLPTNSTLSLSHLDENSSAPNDLNATFVDNTPSPIQPNTPKQYATKTVEESPARHSMKHSNTTNKDSTFNDSISGHHPIQIPDFDSTVPVVIVTKIQDASTVQTLNQCLCLLSHAYNHRVQYDIVVFTAKQIDKEGIDGVSKTVAPANVIFVVDNPGIQSMFDSLTSQQQEHLLARCNVTDQSQLDWNTVCEETTSSGTTRMNIKYNWQAEFRSLHLWKHPVLAKYKYMIWMDSDGFCTRPWRKDPIAEMRRNDLALLFDNFPAGRSNGAEFIPRINEAFGKNICEIGMRNDLDFYRSDPVMKWQKALVGDTKFSRLFDDQIAVTMPAAVLAGNRSRYMRYFGLNMSVFHNFRMDGHKKEKVGSFSRLWREIGPRDFPTAHGSCKIVSSG